MFKPKHHTIKELRKTVKFFMIALVIIAVATIFSSQFMDKHLTNVLFVLLIIYAALTIIAYQVLFYRSSLETQCRWGGRDFMDYCPCKHCRIRREEE